MNANRLMIATVALAVIAGLAWSTPARTDEMAWWPTRIEDRSGGESKFVDYAPLDRAAKKWHLCVLFPHMKDSWWVAADYGIVTEARRQGVKITLFQAGGYTELAKQISQYDDCLALGADAILIGPISEGGMAAKIEEGHEKGITQVSLGNPVHKAPVDAAIRGDQVRMGQAAGEYLKTYYEGQGQLRAVHLPGPAGSGWAEAAAQGIRESLDGSNIEILEERYGDTGKSAQLQLVEDVLQAYDDFNILIGTAVTAEVASGAIADAGRSDIDVFAWYSNQGMVDLVRKGEILGSMSVQPVLQGRIAVDVAVRALEGKPHLTAVFPEAIAITNETIDGFDMTRVFAPEGFQPVYSVE